MPSSRRQVARVVLCAAGLSAAALAHGAAGSPGPVFWPLGYAQHQVFAAYSPSVDDIDVACAPVGPYGRSHGSTIFGEFACDIQTSGGEQLIAVVPTGTTGFRLLSRGQVSPVSGTLGGIAGVGAPQHVAIAGYPEPLAFVLGDQSTWKLTDPQHKSASWKYRDLVLVEPGRTKAHLYRLVDKTRSSELEADFIGFA